MAEARTPIEIVWIPIEQAHLDLENPRFAAYANVNDETDAIANLLQGEEVFELAKDIAKNGINPLEIFGVIEHGGEDDVFIIVEGNRRFCAIKILEDPELVKNSTRRKSIESLNKQVDYDEIPVVIFDNREQARIWLERLHGAPGKGLGRRKWDSDQRQAFSNSAKNKMAAELINYAVSQGMFERSELKRTITTIQRCLGNEVFRNAIGIVAINNEAHCDRTKEDFDLLAESFINGIVKDRTINSRTTNSKSAIIKLANKLVSEAPVGTKRVDSWSLQEAPSSTPKAKSEESDGSSKKPRKTKLGWNDEITDALGRIDNYKLRNLYYSICNLNLASYNVPLATIGTWAFIEALSAQAGRNEGTSFSAFYSKQRLKTWGFDDGDVKAIQKSLDSIANAGNITKHHFLSAQFNEAQLISDFQSVDKLILKTCKEILSQK